MGHGSRKPIHLQLDFTANNRDSLVGIFKTRTRRHDRDLSSIRSAPDCHLTAIVDTTTDHQPRAATASSDVNWIQSMNYGFGRSTGRLD